MVHHRIYDAFYRWWAPWDAVGAREELLRLLDEGEVAPATHPLAVDLGCGTGANVVELAPGLAAVEERRLFGDSFEVEELTRPFVHAACFLLRREAATAGDDRVVR